MDPFYPLHPNTIDLAGKTFGHIRVVRPVGRDKTRHKVIIWECVCDCGKVLNLPGYTIRGSRDTKCADCKTWKGHPRWKGFEEIPGNYLRTTQESAVKRGYTYELMPEFLWELFLAQGRRCALSGLSLQFNKPQTASLDRIDSDVSYVKGNVQWTHKAYNRFKNNYTMVEFVEMCQRVALLHTGL